MPLQPSRHNITGPIAGTAETFIVNPLSGNADVLEPGELELLNSGQHPELGLLTERGYLVDPAEEKARERAAYLDFLDQRDNDEVQIFFATTFACNFGGSYCFQSEYQGISRDQVPEVVEAFFAYVDREFAGRRKYLTLFGGEPLLPDGTTRALVKALMEGCRDRQLDVAVVTNGYTLDTYLDILQIARIREIQITLDGVAEVHDVRRPLLSGKGTFDKIVEGVDLCLERDVAVNLRAVVDKDNLPRLPELARFARDRGWTAHPRFKTQLGRNYELHSCQSDSDRLYTRLEMYEVLHDLIEEHPVILDFHRPAFHVAKELADNGELPGPVFDGCPACKTEWAFEASGRIYPCTANVGKAGEQLGTFWPEVTLDEDKVAEWEDRDILAIDACTSCPQALICGGGCGQIAKNRTGDVLTTDCRPVAELIGLGMDTYGVGR